MAQLTPAQEHELIKSLLKLPPRALSIMVASMGAMRDKHCLHRVFGPKSFTFMPRGKRVIDILDLFNPEDQEYIPGVFSRPCDPAVPIVLQDFDFGTLTSLSPGYMKRIFKIGICDEDLEKIMLRELPNIPWAISDMTDEQKMSAHIFAAARQVQGEYRETNVRSFNHSALYGAFINAGPGIDKADELIDLCRDPKLTVCLQGEGWANKYASIGKTVENLVKHFYNQSKGRCRPTDIVMDELTAQLWEQAIEYQECGKCWTYDPNVIRRQELFNRNALPGDDPFAMRGIKQFPYSNPRLQGINFWVCDEKEKTEICAEDEEGKMVGTGKYHMTPVIPEGSMLIVDRGNMNSTALRGNIHSLRVRGPLDQWSETRESCDGDCLEYVFHASPMDFVGRVNCTMLVNTAPILCPPKCGCTEIECDPKGGKVAAEAANPLRGGFSDSSEAIAQVIARLNEQEKLVGNLQKENEDLAEKLIKQSTDISKLDANKQPQAATKAVKNNNKGDK